MNKSILEVSKFLDTIGVRFQAYSSVRNGFLMGSIFGLGVFMVSPVDSQIKFTFSHDGHPVTVLIPMESLKLFLFNAQERRKRHW